ncbi:MaoC/PaaZ C-terminal domain-containing protein [Sulfobacillus sp. hq2]|uniref:Dehydratase n=1 Tax=Sulfobacillus thermotolerans TaxID=338644 RepID=A0ABN5GZ54_9FIRM|nr:MaoC/PaaZ C-terminal domain-containing protein [Sulfobacillus sp. hq2]AUW93822.1 dehydratase [Sulfobacillus thermotolerans]POB11365.1 dehydratase [Sulfobacillus sp. hq2]
MGWYYEDFQVGAQWNTPARTITESDVMHFAQLSGDFNPLHTDFEFAKHQRFGKPVAHGMLGLSIVLGLIARLNIFDGTAVALLGIDQWKFSAPIFFGDTVHAMVTIRDMRETRDPRYGILFRSVQLVNQTGTVVQSGELNIMMQRKQEGVSQS